MDNTDLNVIKDSIKQTTERLDHAFALITQGNSPLKDAHSLKMQQHALLYASFLTDVNNKLVELNEKSQKLIYIINEFCAVVETTQ